MRLSAMVRNLVLLCFAFTVAILLAELLLRIWTPKVLSYRSVRRSDTNRHHALQPSASYVLEEPEFRVEVKTNSMGLRGAEYIPSGRHEFKIIMLGDSFVEGYGVPVESCMVERLARKPNTIPNCGGRYVVFNFGVAGYSPILEYLYLKERGLPLDPQLVILCYDMSDVQEDFLYAQDAVFDSAGVPVRVRPSWREFGNVRWFPKGPIHDFLQEHSLVFALVRPLIDELKPRPRFEPGNIYAARFMHTIDSTDECWGKYFQQSESYIKLISDTLKKRNIQFLLAVHPRGHQVSANEWTEGRKYFGLGPAICNSAIFKSLQTFCEKNSIPFLNMTETFRRRSKGDLYFRTDDHWTSAGHRVACDTLFSYLQLLGLLDHDGSCVDHRK